MSLRISKSESSAIRSVMTILFIEAHHFRKFDDEKFSLKTFHWKALDSFEFLSRESWDSQIENLEK